MSNEHVFEETTHGSSGKKVNEYASLLVYSVLALGLAFFIRFFIAV